MFRVVVFVLAVLFLWPEVVHGQGGMNTPGTAKVFAYLDHGGGLGYPIMIKVSANFQFERRQELAIGYFGCTRKGRQIPSDWDDGSLSGPTIAPQETFSAMTFTYGYVLYPRHRPERMRYVLRAGIATGTLSTPVNFRIVQGSGWFSSDHWTNDMHDRNMTAFIINPVVQFTPNKIFGASVSDCMGFLVST